MGICALIYWLHHAYRCVGTRGHMRIHIKRPHGVPCWEILILCNSAAQYFNWNRKQNKRVSKKHWKVIEQGIRRPDPISYSTSIYELISQDIPYSEFQPLCNSGQIIIKQTQRCTFKMYLIPNTLIRFNSKQSATLLPEYLTPLQKYPE